MPAKTNKKRRTEGSLSKKKRMVSRSGYAADKYSERVEDAEKSGLTLPLRKGSGFSAAQRGRAVPAERVHRPGRYKAVSAEEASANMTARQRGEMPSIKDGLDGNGTEDSVPSTNEMHEDPAKDYDPLGAYHPTIDELKQSFKEQAEIGIGAPRTLENYGAGSPPAMPDQSAVATLKVMSDAVGQMSDYIGQRKRITMGLADGAMSVMAIDVILSPYGLVVLLPLGDNPTFIPKPGSEITISQGLDSWNCYFPGISFDIPELKLIGLAFVRKEEDNE